MTEPFLTINERGVVELHTTDTIITGVDDVRAALLARPTDSSIMCSSSIDFPREYTDDEATIAFCEAFA